MGSWEIVVKIKRICWVRSVAKLVGVCLLCNTCGCVHARYPVCILVVLYSGGGVSFQV